MKKLYYIFWLIFLERQINLHTNHCVQMVGHDTVINGRAADRVAAISSSESSHGRASLQKEASAPLMETVTELGVLQT